MKSKLTKFTVIKVKTASKNRFVKPEKLQNRSNKGKGKEKKKDRGEGKEEKREKHSYTLSLYNSYLRKLLDAKGPFGDNVFKNPARYVSMQKRGL